MKSNPFSHLRTIIVEHFYMINHFPNHQKIVVNSPLIDQQLLKN